MTLLCGLTLLLITDPGASLSGQVVDSNDDPVQGAIVVVSTARPRIGPATLCPSCYLDCGKRVTTDQEGQFEFHNLSKSLLFSLAAGAPGFAGSITTHYDPSFMPDAKITLRRLEFSDDQKMVRGIVTDLDGRPVPGVQVHTSRASQTNGITASRVANLATPLTLTDASGEFRLAADEVVTRIAIRVTGGEYAPTKMECVPGSAEVVEVEVGPGAGLRGRLISDGTPLSGVEVGLVQFDRRIGNIVTPQEVTTDQDGVFRFDRLPPERDYAIYTHTGQNAPAVLPVSLIAVPAHGQQADLGDVPAHPPRELTIRVRTTGDAPLPEHCSVYVGRHRAWRGSRHPLSEPEAKVTITDVPEELIYLSLTSPGYEISKTVPPTNPDINGNFVLRVDRDREFTFVIEPKQKKKKNRPQESA